MQQTNSEQQKQCRITSCGGLRFEPFFVLYHCFRQDEYIDQWKNDGGKHGLLLCFQLHRYRRNSSDCWLTVQLIFIPGKRGHMYIDKCFLGLGARLFYSGWWIFEE